MPWHLTFFWQVGCFKNRGREFGVGASGVLVVVRGGVVRGGWARHCFDCVVSLSCPSHSRPPAADLSASWRSDFDPTILSYLSRIIFSFLIPLFSHF
jgi:hypothetical protein